jgi:adenylate cyclase
VDFRIALENRLSLPGDSDTVRKQKVAALLAGVAGMMLAFIPATIYLGAGLMTAFWLFAGLAIFMLVVIIWLLAYPRHYFGLVFLSAAVVTVHPWLVQLATGGFQSGTMQSIWTLFGPVSCLLLIGIWPAAVCGLLLVICAAAATILDPIAAASAPQIEPWARQFLGFFNIVALSAMIFLPSLYLFRRMELARAQADNLLLNILPAPIAAKLKLSSDIIAEGHHEVTVLFADIVDFTRLSAQADPVEVVGLLNDIFSEFDDLADQYGLEKIKTIGDAYMAAAGLPLPREDHCEVAAAFALDILAVVEKYHAWNGEPICLRVGINTGPVVAGVIGHRKFIYDLWGDVVNTASRMESHGVESFIQVTAAVKKKLEGRYEFQERPPMVIKGKGEMITYLLVPPQKESVAA